MENLSCHSNHSAWATAIKNNIFVEAIVRNNSAKFQLYPPNSFWGVYFLIYFRKFTLFVDMVTNQILRFWTKFVWIVEDYSRNISVKMSKYLQWDSSKCQFSFFPHYKSMATTSCHSNQRSYPTGTKKKQQYYSFPLPTDAICKIWRESASYGFRGDVVWKCWRWTDGWEMPAYTISSPSAQVS